MTEIKESIYRFVNSILVLFVSQAWVLLLPMAMPEDGQASFMMYWLGINVLLMNIDADVLSDVPNPATILLYAGSAPIFVFVYMQQVIHDFYHEDQDD